MDARVVGIDGHIQSHGLCILYEIVISQTIFLGIGYDLCFPLVVKINVDEEPELASQFQVMSIPTLMVVKDGEVVSKTMGARPKAQINALL